MLTAIRKCFDLIAAASRPAADAGDGARGRPGRLRHDLRGRHDRRVSDREPGADEHAAAAAAALLLRPGDRSRDRPARADSGGHGSSLSAAAQRRGTGRRIPNERVAAVLEQNARRAAVSGAGDAAGGRRGGLHAGRGRSAAPGDGRVAADAASSSSSGRSSSTACWPTGYAAEFAERVFQQIRGFGEYGFPESHAAQLRAARLRLGVAQVPLPGRVRRGAHQQPADGVLRPGAARRAMPASTASRSGRST